ncbi:MAG: hypothetical protein ABH873_05365 [Candidatus Firestonebacteria bacterium]
MNKIKLILVLLFIIGCNTESFDTDKKEYIIPGDSSIEGVKVGKDIKEAEKILSKRFICEKSTIELEGEKCPILFVKEKKGEKLFYLEEDKGKIYRITVISPRCKTKEGIHVGSTLAEAVKVYGVPEIVYGEGIVAIFKKQGKMSFGISCSSNNIYGNINSNNYTKYADKAIIDSILIL